VYNRINSSVTTGMNTQLESKFVSIGYHIYQLIIARLLGFPRNNQTPLCPFTIQVFLVHPSCSGWWHTVGKYFDPRYPQPFVSKTSVYPQKGKASLQILQSNLSIFSEK